MTSQRLTHIALLSSLGFVARLIFSGLPNIQPLTALIIMVSRCLPVFDSMCVAGLSILLSNLVLGMGPWTIFQIAVYVGIVVLVWILEKVMGLFSFSSHLEGLGWSLISGICGFLYGFVISILWSMVTKSISFWPYWVNGLPFDTLHAVGNFVFYLVLSPYVLPQLKKYLIIKLLVDKD